MLASRYWWRGGYCNCDLEEDNISSVGGREREEDRNQTAGSLRGAKEMVNVNDFAEEFGSKRKLRNPVILLQEGQLFLFKREKASECSQAKGKRPWR